MARCGALLRPNDASALPELRVIGRGTSLLFTAGAVDDRVIADTLGVAHLLKGSVRRVGGRVRVNVQLVRAASTTSATGTPPAS